MVITSQVPVKAWYDAIGERLLLILVHHIVKSRTIRINQSGKEKQIIMILYF